MNHASSQPHARFQATDGDIAAINLQSSLQASWSRFGRDPHRAGVAELIVEQEQLTAQYIGDLRAYDRLEALVQTLADLEFDAGRRALITAHVACSTHRFADARTALALAAANGVEQEEIERLTLTIDQATGSQLDQVLAARRERAVKPHNWGERVPLGALLADLGEFDEADRTYQQALQEYPDVSPFPLAWVCFQLGVLWGESVPIPQENRAAQWYQTALDYLPCYVKARVHLSEIYLNLGQYEAAQALLMPVLTSGDPEVSWRLADLMTACGKHTEAESYLHAAEAGFEGLLQKHLLAFADHGAEFYVGSGNNPKKAFELAKANLANRPTLQAYEQAHETAMATNLPEFAETLAKDAHKRWAQTPAFQFSKLGTFPAVANRQGATHPC